MNKSLEEAIINYFRIFSDKEVDLNTDINNDLDLGQYWEDIYVHFVCAYKVDFSGMNCYTYFSVKKRKMPTITIGHMVEVAKLKKWFSPNYLSRDEEIEWTIPNYIQSFYSETVDNNMILKKRCFGKKKLYIGIKWILEFYKVDTTNFSYSEFLSNNKINTTHLIEAAKLKKWFTPNENK